MSVTNAITVCASSSITAKAASDAWAQNAAAIAARYVARTKRSGQTLLQWADIPNPEMVTLGINGGHNGLDDRIVLTGRAFAALTGRATTAEWQSLLLNAGFEPGPIDGLDGPKTQAAKAAAKAQFGVSGEALLKELRAIT